MGFVQEFKEFAMKGNVVDMAVGIIIGAEFGKIVNSMVADIIMPPIGFVIGNVNFVDLFYPMDGKVYESLAAAKTAGAPVFAYGNFIQSVINFIIIAFAIFLMIKVMNSIRKDEPAKA